MSDVNLVIPVNAHPTEALAARFAAWRRVIRQLNVYFKEVASVSEEVVKQNVRLGHAVNFPFFTNGTSSGSSVGDDAAETQNIRQMFLDLDESSISSVPSVAIEFHRAQAATASRTAKELTHNVIPRLEELRRDLVVKIKEIKSLASDFKNSVAREQSETAKEIELYSNAIDTVTRSPDILQARHDPYLIKEQVEKCLRRQVHEENYLLEAFINLQSSGRQLEEVVSQEVQQALTVYGKLMGLQGKNLADLSNHIMTGFVAKDPAFEWDSFVQRDPNFVDPHLRPRQADKIAYPHQTSLLATQIKAGYLERRSKYLKSYSRAWYVLTPSFLHEFKSADRNKDPNPVMSLSLADCHLSRDTRSSSSSSHKFILNTKQNGHHAHRGHNWVFRAESEERMQEWYSTISRLTSLQTPIDRVKVLEPVSGGELLPIPRSSSSMSSPTSTQVTRDDDRSNTLTGAAVAGGAAAAAGTAAAATAAALGGGDEEGADKNASMAALAPSSRAHAEIAGGSGAPATNHNLPREAASPVPSDHSAVTSNGEPYEQEFESAGVVAMGVHEHDQRDDQKDQKDYNEEEGAVGERPARGRFPSDVKLQSHPVDPNRATDDEEIRNEATKFIVPDEAADAPVDNDSVFSYDLEHGTTSTLPHDKDFKPVDADLPVQVERRLTQTSHKNEETYGIGVARSQSMDGSEDMGAEVARRRSSVASRERRPSRRATGSYGTEELKPLTSTEGNGNAPTKLFFADGLPTTTGGKESS